LAAVSPTQRPWWRCTQPSPCASRMTSIHVSRTFPGEIRRRISSSRISAAPPGTESRPGHQAFEHGPHRQASCSDRVRISSAKGREWPAKVRLHETEEILVVRERQVWLIPPEQHLHPPVRPSRAASAPAHRAKGVAWLWSGDRWKLQKEQQVVQTLV